ncbi:MAG TPA: SpoIIE family protein phosphatase [Pseudonocardia sp.]
MSVPRPAPEAVQRRPSAGRAPGGPEPGNTQVGSPQVGGPEPGDLPSGVPEHHLRLPPDARSPGRARRMLLSALSDADLDDAADVVVLLASELCENAVLHAGTEFEVDLRIEADEVVVTVSDHGAGPLEQHLAQQRRRYGRAATHGRGLLLLSRLATAWGTRHERDGTHRTWFSVSTTGAPGDADDALAALDGPDAHAAPAAADPPPRPLAARGHPTDPAGEPPADPPSERVHRLLHLPTELAGRLDADALVAELVRRLREVLDAETVLVEVDEGDGAGPRTVALAGVATSTAGPEGPDAPAADPADAPGALIVALPTTAPLRGRLAVVPGPGAPAAADAADLADLVAHRVAMAVESAWLREVDQRRRAWLAYLADTSELLGQSLDVELTVAVVPQVVVPRLGAWCAVHVRGSSGTDAGRLRLGALTHADEERLPELRAALEPGRAGRGLDGAPDLRAGLDALLDGAPGPVRFTVPTDGVAVPLTAHGTTLGTLSVGRPPDRPHGPEDVTLIADVARRAALAVHNAQVTDAHVRVSQALQRALLPRALPAVPGLDLAAQYLPASTGSDVGGDFYDVYAVDDTAASSAASGATGERGTTAWLVAVGDVCGTGAAAAARTGMLRDVLRVLLREGRPLVRAVELLNEVMLESSDPLQFATLAAALVRVPADGAPSADGVVVELQLVLAGHLQPVLVHPDGRAEQVGVHGTAVGLVGQLDLTCTTHTLAAGDALLFYTDGVTERRRGDEQFGAERLVRAAAAAAGRPAARLVGAVRSALDRFTADPHDDDVALLALRAVPPA